MKGGSGLTGDRKDNGTVGADRQVIRGSSLIGPGGSGVPTFIDVKDGKVTRIRPLDYEMNYDRKEFNAWKIEARGKTFEPPMKGVVGPIGLAYKKRVYSKNRVRYPLKRVVGMTILGWVGAATLFSCSGKGPEPIVQSGQERRAIT